MSITMPRRKLLTDGWLFNVVLMLIAVGIVTVFDSSFARAMDVGNDAFYFLKRQALWACIGVGCMFAATRIDYWKLRQLAAPMLVGAFVLLLLVWCPGIGIHVNHAARWIGRGAIQLQPSEFAKLALIIYLAALLSRRSCDLEQAPEGIIPPLVVVGGVCLLVELEPDMGTAMVIGLASLTVLVLAGARVKHILWVLAAGAVLLSLMAFRHSYRVERLEAWLNPEKHAQDRGYQVMQGLVAVGSGGARGVGIGAGRGKLFLPEANSDFIFATIAEETGLWGSCLVILLLGGISWRAFDVARRTSDRFGALLAAGIGSVITWQALVNIAVVTNSIPATGVPLPFISYGGSSLVFLLTSVGILLNVARHAEPAAGRRQA